MRILTHIAEAMAPGSRVLIADLVIPERLNENSLHAGVMDIFMVAVGGKERTDKMLRKILDRAGLRLQKLWQRQGRSWAVVDAVLK